MKKAYFYQAIFAFILVVTGCTTAKDFQKMSPHQRAGEVCKKQKGILDLAQQKQVLEAMIADSQMALSRGYRIHNQCQQVKVYGNATTSCSTIGGSTVCQQDRPESYETKCTETPVSLNPDLENSNISSWQRSLEYTNEKLQSVYKQCYQYFFNASPEEAYKYYRAAN